MGVRRAQDRCVLGARLNAEIVDEVAATAQQRGILDALDRTTDPRPIVAPALIDRCCGPDRGLHHVPAYLPARSSTRRGQLSGREAQAPYRPLSRLTKSSHLNERPCAAISARKARDVAEFARADAGMVTEEAREMRGLRKTEALAELPKPRVLA